LEFDPIASSLIAVIFKALNPAWLSETEFFRIENGSANTTLSAMTSDVVIPFSNVRVYAPPAVRFAATRAEPVTSCEPRMDASVEVIRSLPPRT
jgi:hypothetical protein